MYCSPTVYRSAKFLKFFVRFDQILYIFFEKLSASGELRPPGGPLPGLRPWTPLGDFLPQIYWVCRPTPNRMLLLPPLGMDVNTQNYCNSV